MDSTDVLTGILIVITGIYCFVTYKIQRANESAVAAMREQSDALTRPYIAIAPYLPPKGSIFYLKISNLGKTAAVNLHLTLDKTFFRFGEKREDNDLRSYSAFNSSIKSFQPGAEILFYLAQGHVLFGKEADPMATPTVFSVSAKYEYRGVQVEETTEVDLRPYLNSAVPPDPLIDSLEDIKKAIEGQ